MRTKIQRVSPEELIARREAILESLGMSRAELDSKVRVGGLVGAEWSAWSEIEDIEYLLEP